MMPRKAADFRATSFMVSFLVSMGGWGGGSGGGRRRRRGWQRLDVEAGERFELGEAFFALDLLLGDEQADVKEGSAAVDQLDEAAGSCGVGLACAVEHLVGLGEDL